MEPAKILYVEKVIPTELVIQKQIIDAVYSQREDIFRNKERFEVVLSQPARGFNFHQVKGIYKGRYICGNNKCLQLKKDKGQKEKPKRKLSDLSEDSNRSPNHPSWLKWWNTQQLTIKPALKMKNQDNSDIMSIISAPRSLASISQTTNSKRSRKQIKQPFKPIHDNLYENSRWASSLSYVIFNYCSKPAPLQQLLDVYNSPKKIKIEIFVYVQLMGQKCQKCVKAFNDDIQKEKPGYEYPFFGKTELKRMRKNFSSYIYNKIFGKQIKRYRPCQLRELQDHKNELCQACQKGTCKKSFSTENRKRR